MELALLSPNRQRPLREVAPGLLGDGETEWPVVDGIPYLRAGGAARAAAVEHLRAGDVDGARRVLLTDRDRFAPGEPVDPATLAEVRPNTRLTLRAAMDRLGYGAVGTYFAHRWSSPTWLSGVDLLERTVVPRRPNVEVACGIGHFLRLLERNGYRTVGIDIVWSKLWLARHLMGVTGPLVCADVEHHNPLAEAADRTVFCHDAFYFFEHKIPALRHLRDLAGPAGALAIGHVHTATDEHEAGFAEPLENYRRLTEATITGDDGRTMGAAGGGGGIAEATPRDKAVSWIEGQLAERRVDLLPATGHLRVNPLLTEGGVAWPSDGWRAEYLADAENLNGLSLPSLAEQSEVRDIVRRGNEGLSLTPERAASLRRRRVLLDLPAAW